LRGPVNHLVVGGAIERAEIPVLCERLGRLLAGGASDVVVCDVSQIVVNLDAVDALARLQLTAGRLGGRITLAGSTPRLDELLAICGLATTFPSRPAGRPAAGRRTDDLNPRAKRP
jgi:anti-anti-sigma regulatory factor